MWKKEKTKFAAFWNTFQKESLLFVKCTRDHNKNVKQNRIEKYREWKTQVEFSHNEVYVFVEAEFKHNSECVRSRQMW